MRRHELDLIALVFGATFLVLGLAYAVARWSWIGGDRGWLLGVLLIALGGAGVVTIVGRHRRSPGGEENLG